MSTHPFGVEASPGKLCVEGEVDLAVAAELLGAILSAGRSGDGPDLVVDLSDVTFLDCAGISALVDAAKRLDEEGIDLRVVSASTFVEKVLSVTRVNAFLCCPGGTAA